MRGNSGKEESRNNLRDPTLRDHQKKRTATTVGAGPRTAGTGSGARKSGRRSRVREDGKAGGR